VITYSIFFLALKFVPLNHYTAGSAAVTTTAAANTATSATTQPTQPQSTQRSSSSNANNANALPAKGKAVGGASSSGAVPNGHVDPNAGAGGAAGIVFLIA
jgi:hypothetical protein